MNKVLFVLLSCLIIFAFVSCTNNSKENGAFSAVTGNQTTAAPSDTNEQSKDNTAESTTEGTMESATEDTGDSTDDWTKDYPIT